ncbi:hypothetical protein NF681_07020 [Comamonadaceae bacterium OTU4NAUVB1]|nr:hypothetical protein NF681_07020 [Comamonadaceae bacterium OTU4NAUVB1]
MIINTNELFSSVQSLPALGDAVSQPVENLSMGNLLDAERPFLHIRTAGVAPRSEGLSVLEVGLLHSDDGQRFAWAISPIPDMEIRTSTPWAFTPMRLPGGLKRFLMLRYRVTGDRLIAGALTAFLSADAVPPSPKAQPAQRERRQNVTAQHEYYPSGFSFPHYYNQPGKYEEQAAGGSQKA